MRERLIRNRVAARAVGLCAAALLLPVLPVLAQTAQSSGPDTVYVAPPTGDREADRARIRDALDRVRPGGAVRFAPGTYLVGPLIPVPVPRITLLGHSEGTTLRGCDPAEYEEAEKAVAAASGPVDAWAAVSRCGMLELTGGYGTVRNLTFEYTRLGLILGCCHAEAVFRPTGGGYRIEGNTFRNSGNGIRSVLRSAEPSVIRGNTFINTFHAISAAGSHLHVLDNHISVPEPERVPGFGFPSFAMAFNPITLPPGNTIAPADGASEHHVIAGNRIEGHPDGIFLRAYPGTIARHNTIRGNTIIVRRVRFPAARSLQGILRVAEESDSTIVGLPLALDNRPQGFGGAPSGEEGVLEDNVVEDNRVSGAEGLGILLHRTSRNRIINNTVTGVRRRDPFPGNVLMTTPEEEWRKANGAGIWVSAGSEENEIRGNTFTGVEGAAIVLEGDRNRVETRSATDRVRDLGRGNRVSGSERASGDPPRGAPS